jgi:ankyrin repeat protein
MKRLFDFSLPLSLFLALGCSRQTFVADNLIAASKSGDTNTISTLLHTKADVNALLPYESLGRVKVPLIDIAIESGQLETVRFMLKMSADSNRLDERGETPLTWAIGHINNKVSPQIQLNLIGLLLEYGANPNLHDRNQTGTTPLIWATMLHQDTVVAALIRGGANVNLPDLNGNTPLHFVEDSEIAILLLRAGATRLSINKNGKTPLDIATSQKRSSILDILTKSISDESLENKH